MKQKSIDYLLLITLVFTGILLGVFLARNAFGSQIIVQTVAAESTDPSEPPAIQESAAEEKMSFPININTASREVLVLLPGIGDVLAERIIAYRQSFGQFETLEELMEVDGISQKKFDAVSGLITLE